MNTAPPRLSSRRRCFFIPNRALGLMSVLHFFWHPHLFILPLHYHITLYKMKYIPLCLLTLLAITACTSRNGYDALLTSADSLLNQRPDSVIQLLQNPEGEPAGLSTRQRMHRCLLFTAAQNKCDTVFRSDSLQRVLADYYDLHGTPNERMRAHYLLGRAYSDMGEAPRALQCFQDAAACADTTAADCDYHTLVSIYGQMAYLFEKQRMSKEEIDVLKLCSYYAKKDNDTFTFIKAQEMQIVPFFNLDDTASCYHITNLCHQLYLENGMTEAAAGVYYPVILLLLQKQEYERALPLMRQYEQYSGLFDESGNIKPGLEHYYYSKGLYYQGIHLTDSAELYFRKLLNYSINHNYEAYKGLRMVFHAWGNSDSVMKYSSLCEVALDSIQADEQWEALNTTISLYNYNRLEREANQNRILAERTKTWAMLIMILVLAVFAIVYRRHLVYKKKRQDELGKIASGYMETLYKYQKAERQLSLIKTSTDSIIRENQKEIDSLNQQLLVYRQKMESLKRKDIETALQRSETVLLFKDKAKGKKNQTAPDQTEWHALASLLEEHLPTFYTAITQDGSLSEQEKRTCMLSRLRFSNGEIAILLDTSPQRITNVKKNSNSKLFGEETATSLNKNLMNL